MSAVEGKADIGRSAVPIATFCDRHPWRSRLS